MVRDELVNIALECKIKNINKITDTVVKEDLKRKYYKNSNMQRDLNNNAMEELESMIGMRVVKKQVEQVVNYINVNKKRGKMPMLHMCFSGNPGTGKTTAARIIGKIFSQMKILSEKEIFVEAQRADLIGEYVGQTAPKTMEKIDEANGGILFIDEAYTLSSYIQDEAGRDYGAECIGTLIKEMEDKRDSLCVILAGYSNEMDHLLKANPGFESRIQFKIEFPDYTEEELYEIFRKMAGEESYKISNNVKPVLIEYFAKEKLKDNFSNGRCARNLFEKVKFEQANRVSKEEKANMDLIKKCDVENVVRYLNSGDGLVVKNKIGFAL